MSNLAARVLFSAIGIVFSFSANAFDLDGAWTTDASNCDKVFVKKDNRISMTRNSDVFGGGFIVEGNLIRGQAKTCKIAGRKEEGDVLHLIVSCTTEISVLDTQEVSAKLDNDNKLTRNFPAFPEMGISYFRCKL
jgi:hypothetical protein